MKTTTLYQHGTLAMLVPGLFAGTQTIAELLQHGDTGIGTLTGLDGELMILHGHVYQASAEGKIREVDPEEKVPFANVHFDHTQRLGTLEHQDAKAAKQQLLTWLGSTNIFAAVQVVGEFAHMHTRAVAKQQPPYPTLTETAAAQKEFHADHVLGTLVGYFSPEVYAGAVAPGFHLHFLADDRSIGGHVLDFTVAAGEAFSQSFTDFQLHLPTQDVAFQQQQFDAEQLVADIRQAEN